MSKVEKMSIALTPELAEVVRGAVNTGDYASSSEVIRDALRLWAHTQKERAAKLADLRAAIQVGIDSGVAGEREPLEEMLARNRSRLAELRRG